MRCPPFEKFVLGNASWYAYINEHATPTRQCQPATSRAVSARHESVATDETRYEAAHLDNGMTKKGKKADKSSATDGSAATAAAVSIETLKAGDGANVPKPGVEVTVHYTGSLVADGSIFDSSRAKRMPFVFTLGAGGVIKGWDMGVAQMSLGQRAKLTIAASAGYGAAGCVDKINASGTGVIPPNADLCFDVELLDIGHKQGVVHSTRQLEHCRGPSPLHAMKASGRRSATQLRRLYRPDSAGRSCQVPGHSRLVDGLQAGQVRHGR